MLSVGFQQKMMSPSLYNTLYLGVTVRVASLYVCITTAGKLSVASSHFQETSSSTATSDLLDSLTGPHVKRISLPSHYEMHPSTPMFQDSSGHVCSMLGWKPQSLS